MDGFGDNFDDTEIDPAADFLAREQDQRAGLEDELKPAAVPLTNALHPTPIVPAAPVQEPVKTKIPVPRFSTAKLLTPRSESTVCTSLKKKREIQVLTPRSESTVCTSSQKKRKLYHNVKSPIRTYIQTVSPVLVAKINAEKEFSGTKKKFGMSSEKKKIGTLNIPTTHGSTKIAQKLNYGLDEETENVDPNISLPPVSYKSAPNVFLKDNQDVQKKLPKLNEKFKKLLDKPRPKITKHEGRTNVPPSTPGSLQSTPQSASATKGSSSGNIQGDISICETKTLFKTNALAK